MGSMSSADKKGHSTVLFILHWRQKKKKKKDTEIGNTRFAPKIP
jgi:hypothetical protein